MKKKTGPAKQRKAKNTSRSRRRNQMEEALRQSEERYQTIIEKMEEGYFEIDLSGNFTVVNDTECRNMGYTHEELIGMNYRQYTDKRNAARVFEVFNKIYKTGVSEKVFDYEVIRKDGTVIYSELSVSLIRDTAGKPVGFRGISRHITEQKKYEEELALLRYAMDISRDMIYLVDRTTMRFLYVNDMACKLTGYTREEFMRTPPQDILHTDRETLEKAYDEAIAAAPGGITAEMKTRTKDGTRTIVEMHRTGLRMGNRWIIVSTAIDISRRWLAEQSTRLLGRMFAALSATNEAVLHATSPEDLYQRVCDAAVDGGQLLSAGVLLFDTETPWVMVAAASGAGKARLYQARISTDESIPEGRGLVGAAYRLGKPCISNDYLNDPASQTWRAIAKDVGAAAVVPLTRGGQPIGALAFYAREKRIFDGEVVRLLERMADNVVFGLYNFELEENRQRAEERIQYFATHDSLTDMPNRLMFSQMLNHAIQSAKRHGRQFAVLFMDLDRFKYINDTLGHEAGDLLLQEVAARLKQTLRASDVIARLGGDEFVTLVEEVDDTAQVVVVAQKILAAVIKPMLLMGQDCRVTASIGISMYPRDDTDEQSLMKDADIAMYYAKEEGKNNFQFYSKDIKSQATERLSIETNLRLALERNELSVYYQAKLDLKTGAITGVEALLRWQSPNLGPVSPVHFIPVAEETGIIVPIGSWVLKTVCAQNVAWQRQGLPPIHAAVNLSLRQLIDDNLLIDIRSALRHRLFFPGPAKAFPHRYAQG
jgi:diguanylate cyclase (GGDEF)-like protein/PAS domain S-box-containing protein